MTKKHGKMAIIRFGNIQTRIRKLVMLVLDGDLKISFTDVAF